MSERPVFRMAFSAFELSAKIEHGSPFWRPFNGSFENEEVTAISAAWMIADGRAFTTWHANSWRHARNFLCGQHLGVDFDRKGADAVLLDPFVQEFAAIVYPTPSSTFENPRCRAVFLLDTPIMQAQNYVRAAKALIWVFGAEADRQCKDAARFFYGSSGCIPVRRDNVLPLAKVRALIAQHEAIVEQPKARPADYKPRTTEAADAQRILERLSASRADDYGEWVAVGMALHASGLGGEGLRMWDAWSARSQKYEPGECEWKWNTFDGDGVTMGTLVKWAREDSP